MNSYFRFLSHHKLFTAINIVGLCLSMAFLLLLGDLIYRQTTVENYQTRADRTFVLGNEEFMMSHFRVGQKLMDRFPEIEDWCSVAGYNNLPLHANGQDELTNVLVASDNFFQFFDYRLIEGNREKVLESPTQIVVSRSFAQRVWPDEEAVGKELTLGDADEPDECITYTVSGVMDDFDRSVIPSDYGCVINVENLRTLHPSAYSEHMGNAASCVLFLMEREGCNLRAKTTEMRDYMKTFFWLYQMEAVKEVTLTPFSTLYYDGKNCSIGQSDDLNHGNRQMTWLYVVIALLVLVFAIFNYVNLSVTLTTDRSKEVAMRRLLGSPRAAVFGKLIGESILFTFVAFVLCYVIALALQDKAVELANCPMNLLKDTGVVAVVLVLLLICLTGFVAGFVPASVLSGYQPIDIVRGTFRRRVRQRWSHVLMVAQAVFAIVMLTVSLLLSSNIRSLMSQPLGYDIENILQTWGISNLTESQRTTLRQKMMSLAEVEAVGFGYGTPIEGLENNTTTAPDGTVVSQRYLLGDSTFFNILGIRPNCVYGDERNIRAAAAVNYQLLRQAGLSDDAREVVLGRGETEDRFQVTAVYPDMVYHNVMEEREHPTPYQIFRTDEYRDSVTNWLTRNYGNPREALVKYHGDRKRVEQALVSAMAELTGHEGFAARALADIHQMWYKDYERFLRVLEVFTIVALLIAILGLMAMNSYFVSQRRREIAVRRVFGAEVGGITWQLLRTVMLQSFAAVIIAVPLSWWLAPLVGSISGLPISMQFLPLFLAILIVITVNLLTAVIQSWRAATENPINSIKTE